MAHKRLAHHIRKVLLRESYCVLPSLGGFVRQDYGSQFSMDGGVLLCPHSEIYFNEGLKHQDGLLEQSYAITYALSIRRARLIVEKDIKELKTQLVASRKVEIKGIGQLCLSREGALTFIPEKIDQNDPIMYGLSSTALYTGQISQNRLLTRANNDEVFRNENIKKRPIVSDRYIHLMIPKQVVNIAAVIVVVILTLLPLGELNLNNGNVYTAGFSHSEVKSSPNISQKTSYCALHNTLSGISSMPDILKEESTPLTMTHQSKKENSISLNQNKPYHIVIGSDQNEDRINKYYNQLIEKKILDNLSILKSKTMYRLVVASFSDKTEAYNYLNAFVKKYPKFNTAWVYKN